MLDVSSDVSAALSGCEVLPDFAPVACDHGLLVWSTAPCFKSWQLFLLLVNLGRGNLNLGGRLAVRALRHAIRGGVRPILR